MSYCGCIHWKLRHKMIKTTTKKILSGNTNNRIVSGILTLVGNDYKTLNIGQGEGKMESVVVACCWCLGVKKMISDWSFRKQIANYFCN